MKKITSYLAMLPAVVLAKDIDELYGESAARIGGTEGYTIANVLIRILNIVLQVGGIAAFIMLIVGGFQFLTAGGDPKRTQAAGQTITYAIFGLIAIIAAWFIMLFIKEFTGADVIELKIPYVGSEK